MLPSEHPYAQISKSTNDNNENRPTTSSSMSNSNLNTLNNNNVCDNELTGSRESLLDSVDGNRQHQVKFTQIHSIRHEYFD